MLNSHQIIALNLPVQLSFLVQIASEEEYLPGLEPVLTQIYGVAPTILLSEENIDLERVAGARLGYGVIHEI